MRGNFGIVLKFLLNYSARIKGAGQNSITVSGVGGGADPQFLS